MDIGLTAQELGRGTSAKVILGEWRGREVAVKLLPLSGPAAAREALAREVRLLVRLTVSCRHTVQLHGISVKDGQLALVMRRYPASLVQHLENQSGGTLTPGPALLLARDLLCGLAELHAHGVVMADMKPHNVLMDDTGRPVLCDFGIARAVTSTVGQHMVTSAQGTYNYMAPEQFDVGEGSCLDPQSDMWGFAATMVHVLTGRPPWAGLNVGQITMQVGVHGRAPDLPHGLPAPLRDLLHACFAREPHSRPAAAGALACLEQALCDALEAPHVSATTSAPAESAAAEHGGHANQRRKRTAADMAGGAHPDRQVDQQHARLPASASTGARGSMESDLQEEQRQARLPSSTSVAVRVADGLDLGDAFMVLVPVPPGHQPGTDVPLPLALLQAATGYVRIPHNARRYLLQPQGMPAVDLTQQFGGSGVLKLPCPSSSPDQMTIVIVDTRQPKPRLQVGVKEDLDGGAMYFKAYDVEVDYTWDTERLAECVEAMRDPGAPAATHRRLEVDAGALGCYLPTLLGSGIEGPWWRMQALAPVNTRVYVQLDGRTLPVPVHMSWRVVNAKLAVTRLTGLPPRRQQLVFGGLQLEDERTLAEYGLQPEAVLRLAVRLP